MTEESKPFHALDGNAWSPNVERFVGATTNVSETEDHRWRRCARGSMEAVGEINQLSAEGSGTPKHIAGFGSVPGPTVSGSHGPALQR